MQEEYIFDLVYLEQEEGWWLDKIAIVMYTNFFLVQWEYVGIILLSERITVTSLEWCEECLSAKDLMEGIRNEKGY